MARAMVVFPVPGGPARQRMVLRASPPSARIETHSSILRLLLCIPWWARSSSLRTRARSTGGRGVGCQLSRAVSSKLRTCVA